MRSPMWIYSKALYNVIMKDGLLYKAWSAQSIMINNSEMLIESVSVKLASIKTPVHQANNQQVSKLQIQV
jgi:hypothetical protein